MRLIGRPWLYCGLAIIAFLATVGPVMAGHLPGNDDLMRALQVRDLAAGDDWYAVDQPRYISPEKGDMHWSRLPDLGPLLIYSAAGWVTGEATALYFAASLWPVFLFCLLVYATAWAAHRLNIPLIGQAIALLGLVHSQALAQFQPGRIDHHGLILVLAMTAFAAILSTGRRAAAVAGVSVAAMLTVALESLPLAAALVLALGLLWIVDPERQAGRLSTFGAALSIGSLATFFLDAPGPGPARAVCDAFGQSHFVATAMGGAGLGLLGMMSRLTAWGWTARLGAGVGAGFATLAAFAVVAPDCLGSPYAGLPQVVQQHWLSNVSEARSMWSDFLVNGPEVISRHAFPLLAFGAGLIWAKQASNDERLYRSVLVLVLGVVTLATLWQIRSGPMAHIFGVLVAGGVVGPMFHRWLEERDTELLAIAGASLLLLSPFIWRKAGEAIHTRKITAEAKTTIGAADCRSAEVFTPLAGLPALEVFAPIDLGAPLLLHTSHLVYAAPYHRNAQGIALALEIFAAPPEEARVQLEQLGAQAVAFCPGMNEAKLYKKMAPEGLGVKLNTGEVPDWLDPVTEPGGAIQLYRLRD